MTNSLRILPGLAFLAGCASHAHPGDVDAMAPTDGSAAADLGAPEDGGNDAAAAPWTSLSLVAGALGGLGNADGVGDAARFHSPQGITSDGAGNLYVSDTLNHTIRAISLATGAVTTRAGSPGAFGSTDGTGTAARFYGPADGLVVDAAGNLYVADSENETVRKIVLASGEVTTIAGTAGMSGSVDGVGPAARFGGHSPLGMVGDGAGNLYLADTYNHTIRKLELATGTVTTIAGAAGQPGYTDGLDGSSARFDYPMGLALDAGGNLYVADQGNDTIRKVVLSTGATTTLAGLPGAPGAVDGVATAARFTHPEGLALDGAGNLYIADSGNHAIRKLVLATGDVSTLAGGLGVSGSADATGANARFFYPRTLVDIAGNLYVTDTSNAVIRKVVIATGAVTTIAGHAATVGSTDGNSALFRSPHGAAADADGNVYLADTYNHTIREVAAATGSVSTLAGTAGASGTADGTGADARFNLPSAVALDGAGNLYVSDTKNHTIRRLVLASGAVTTLAGSAGTAGSADGVGPAAQFNGPTGLVADGAGNVYVCDNGNATVRKLVAATGEVSTIAGTAGMTGTDDGTGAAARFMAPWGITLDGAGVAYVSDYSAATIRRLVLATGEVTTIAGRAGTPGAADGTGAAAQLNRPIGLSLDGAGNLYVADWSNSAIRKIALATGDVTTVVGVLGRSGVAPGPLPAGLNMPLSVTVMPTGGLIVVDSAENAVLAVH